MQRGREPEARTFLTRIPSVQSPFDDWLLCLLFAEGPLKPFLASFRCYSYHYDYYYDYYLNAPCGAVTAAPHFWRSAFGAADCIPQIENYGSKFSVFVFCWSLTLAYFCRDLYVLDVCCNFSSFQATLASLGVGVFRLRLNLACFCKYLFVLDVCCQFASCRATLAICKYYCKNASEMNE